MAHRAKRQVRRPPGFTAHRIEDTLRRIAIVVSLSAGFAAVFSFLDSSNQAAEYLARTSEALESLSGNMDWKQTLANVVGSAIGVIGAYLVARWQMSSTERARRGQRSELASAFYNVAQDRYLMLKGMVDSLTEANHPDGRIFVERTRAVYGQVCDLAIQPVPDDIRSVISAQLPYESIELYDLDRCLLFAKSAWRDVVGFYQNSQEVKAQNSLAKVIDALKTAAMDWENIIAGCDSVAFDAGFPEKFRRDVEVAAQILDALDALTPLRIG